jgi:hypothetical protein
MPGIIRELSRSLAAKKQLNTNIAMLLVHFWLNILKQQQTTADSKRAQPKAAHIYKLLIYCFDFLIISTQA